MTLSQLSLLPLHRPGQNLPGGGQVTERHSTDFVVNGRRLSEILGGDLASCLGWGKPDWEELVVERLLRRTPADYPPDRVALYICPECGGLDCGAISARVTIAEGTVTWEDFGWQRDPEDNEPPRLDYPGVGPFSFDRASYLGVLRSSYEPRKR